MAELGPGLYELLITEGLRAQIDELAERLPVDERALGSADASDRIAWHVSRQIERALLYVSDEGRVEVGLRVAPALLDRLGEFVETDASGRPIDPATVLHAILQRRPDGTPVGKVASASRTVICDVAVVASDVPAMSCTARRGPIAVMRITGPCQCQPPKRSLTPAEGTSGTGGRRVASNGHGASKSWNRYSAAARRWRSCLWGRRLGGSAIADDPGSSRRRIAAKRAFDSIT